MERATSFKACGFGLFLLIALLGDTARAQVTVVNMVPVTRSEETCQDSETSLAIDPSNPLQIAGTAFTWDNFCNAPGSPGVPASFSELAMTAGGAPIYVSVDNGQTWTVQTNVPSTAGGQFPTGDITVDFSRTLTSGTSVLYTGILHAPDFNMNVLNTQDFRLNTAQTLLDTRTDNVDQPHTAADTVPWGSDEGKDRVYVGFNNGFNGVHSQTATVDESLDADIASPTFNLDLIETRSTGTAGQDGFANVPGVHPDGTVYVLFYGWRADTSAGRSSDIVVVRDDNWGSGGTPYTALVDTDAKAGMRVVQGVIVPQGTISQERLGASNLALAVDPTNSSRVYISWADVPTATINQTLHVRRSTDRGVTWSADLLTVANAISPALAINSHEQVGFLYQLLTGTGSTQRWETHFTRTTDPDGTMFDNPGLTLSTTPASTPADIFWPYLGDYEHVVAWNQDFYGLFTAGNSPDNANFPNGVTFARYADFTAHQLYAEAAHLTPVSTSIDPYFFHVATVPPGSDFYVRDWTETPVNYDHGEEPSTHVWWTNSDVWNRLTNAPGSFNANDQPDQQNAQEASVGHNYAFARVSRVAAAPSGSPDAAVTAEFLYADYGMGIAYQVLGTAPALTFHASDVTPQVTSGVQWDLPVGHSTHVCMAVEINAPGDPSVPDLAGLAPGISDPLIVDDNNKAQINMDIPVSGGGGRASFYGIVHNGELFARDIVVQYTADPIVLRRLGDAQVEVIGSEPRPFGDGGTFTLKNMQPGENRWIGVNFASPDGDGTERLPVTFMEMAGTRPVNGFTIAAVPSPLSEVINQNVKAHAEVFGRLGVAFHTDAGEDEGEAARKFLREATISENRYVEFLKKHEKEMARAVDKLVDLQKGQDPFGIQSSLKDLGSALATGKAGVVAGMHTTLLNRLDSFQTMAQKAEGDAGDALQMVRWQKKLYSTVPQLRELAVSGFVVQESQEFIDDFGKRKRGVDGYPELMRELMKSFRTTAETLETIRPELEKNIRMMEENLSSPNALEKAHREYLLNLAGLPK